jgi:hypothetical protein
MKGGNGGTPFVPAAGEDLTPMLKKSLGAMRNKKGGR